MQDSSPKGGFILLQKWKQKLVNNEKGFTLVEILVVIVIIGILFTVILPRIDFASNKARETGIKTDFRIFAQASEQYLRESVGSNLTIAGLNEYLDKAYFIKADNTSTKVDPWGNAYKVTIGTGTLAGSIKVDSFGKKGTAVPDYLTTSYYYQGSIDMCTAGLKSGDITIQTFTMSATAGPATITGNTCGNAVTALK